MKQILRSIIWICKYFDREQILELIDELVKVFNNESPEIKLKDNFDDMIPNKILVTLYDRH